MSARSGAALALRWEEPPPAARARRRRGDQDDHEAIAEALRARPGEWAVIPVSGALTGITSHIQSARMVAYRPAGAFEAVRRLVDGETRVYARFVGQDLR